MLNVDLVPRQAPMGTDESIWQLDYCAVQVDDLDVIPASFPTPATIAPIVQTDAVFSLPSLVACVQGASASVGGVPEPPYQRQPKRGHGSYPWTRPRRS